MSEFEVLSIPVSLIVGLGITRILGGLINLVRARENTLLHWVPITWAISILLYCVGYFNILYDLSVRADSWTWVWYGPVLIQTMFLFLSAGLVFPRDPTDQVPDLMADFRKHGRLSLIPLGLLLGTASYFNVLQGGVWLHWGNALNLALTMLIVVCFVRVRHGPAMIPTMSFGVLTVIGWIFLFAQPGD